jgi:hypothetical protein|tara:strand:- start:231 stop:521 length:291 start_codon:yes stop_codon:yes gene_type:complete
LDLEKLEDYRSCHFNQRRLGTLEAVGFYFNTTSENRNTSSQNHDERKLNMLFSQIEQSGRKFIDQILALYVQMQGLKRGDGNSVNLVIATNPLPTT